MQQLLIKNDISAEKMNALLSFLKSWEIDAEIKINKLEKKSKFSKASSAIGMWKDYQISGKELREKAWNRK